ncbi:MAG: 4-hydroxythreonine-4-phosphate dehydrogenase PdxA [Burkholderiales bacterium]|nr:4-hydroxythreonine-4-phosphate dehydrogenase PdxA [Burkholderiales bacterium]
MTPRIGITLGDPAGIGPEIALKALAELAPRMAAGEFSAVLYGARSAVDAAACLLGSPLTLVDPGAPAVFPGVSVHDIGGGANTPAPGSVTAEGGRQAYDAVVAAVADAMARQIDAVVTGPLSKEALHLAGQPFAGHTEMLASLTGTSGSVMMLAHGHLRVSHATTHVALADVPRLITQERLARVFGLTVTALKGIGIARPRIAVAGLNPHAGEGGLFGRQDGDVIAPAIAAFGSAEADLSGPHPGDTVFVKAAAGEFDAVVAMYHDQGHIPVKLLGFRVDAASGRWVGLSGVNITLGLPIIRTSVDHGTAADIAGRGIASPQSLVEAVDYALLLARRRPSLPGEPKHG